jgi:hypothetical protein
MTTGVMVGRVRVCTRFVSNRLEPVSLPHEAGWRRGDWLLKTDRYGAGDDPLAAHRKSMGKAVRGRPGIPSLGYRLVDEGVEVRGRPGAEGGLVRRVSSRSVLVRKPGGSSECLDVEILGYDPRLRDGLAPSQPAPPAAS